MMSNRCNRKTTCNGHRLYTCNISSRVNPDLCAPLPHNQANLFSPLTEPERTALVQVIDLPSESWAFYCVSLEEVPQFSTPWPCICNDSEMCWNSYIWTTLQKEKNILHIQRTPDPTNPTNPTNATAYAPTIFPYPWAQKGIKMPANHANQLRNTKALQSKQHGLFYPCRSSPACNFWLCCWGSLSPFYNHRLRGNAWFHFRVSRTTTPGVYLMPLNPVSQN